MSVCLWLARMRRVKLVNLHKYIFQKPNEDIEASDNSTKHRICSCEIANEKFEDSPYFLLNEHIVLRIIHVFMPFHLAMFGIHNQNLTSHYFF